MNAVKSLLFVLPAAFIAASSPADTVDFDFAEGDHGWVAGFADYPAGQEEFFELQADHRPRPENLGGAGALYISGNNHSDDLFMYYKKRIGSLQPGAIYAITFDVEFASMYPDGSIGIGGSPANSVYFKAGAANVEPDTEVIDGYHRMNIDKGNQAGGGADAIVLGDVAKPKDGTFDYVLITRHNGGNPFLATTDPEGGLWLLFGTDSGFEGTTSLYYTNFRADVVLIPEPASGTLLAAGCLCVAVLVLRRRRGA